MIEEGEEEKHRSHGSMIDQRHELLSFQNSRHLLCHLPTPTRIWIIIYKQTNIISNNKQEERRKGIIKLIFAQGSSREEERWQVAAAEFTYPFTPLPLYIHGSRSSRTLGLDSWTMS